jgi:hypothetical protein
MDLELDILALEFVGHEGFPFIFIDLWEDHFTCSVDTSLVPLDFIGTIKIEINMIDWGPDPRILMDNEFEIKFVDPNNPNA